MVTEAKLQSKSRPWIIELLIFVLLFIIAQLITLIPMFFVFPVMMILDPAGMAMIGENDISNMPASLLCISLFLMGILIAVSIFYVRVIEKRKLRTMGFRKGTLHEYGRGLLFGLGYSAVAIGFSFLGEYLLTGTLTGYVIQPGLSIVLIIAFLVGFMVQGASEEIMVRGYLMVSLARRQTLPVAIILSALIFASLHIFNTTNWFSIYMVFYMLYMVLSGAFFAVYIIKRGSIWGACAIHSIYNFSLFMMLYVFTGDVSGFMADPLAAAEQMGIGIFILELAAPAVALVVVLLMKQKEIPVIAENPAPSPAFAPPTSGSMVYAPAPAPTPAQEYAHQNLNRAAHQTLEVDPSLDIEEQPKKKAPVAAIVAASIGGVACVGAVFAVAIIGVGDVAYWVGYNVGSLIHFISNLFGM
jgi:membrane protease YdiL (CAAX protease family)